jgi:hypothetical protein
VLVGHYLGVDHAGHTDDVFAPTMAAKLAQMDAQLAQVCKTHLRDFSPSFYFSTLDPLPGFMPDKAPKPVAVHPQPGAICAATAAGALPPIRQQTEWVLGA